MIKPKTNWLLKKETEGTYSLMRTRGRKDVSIKVAHLNLEVTEEPLRNKHTIRVPFHRDVFSQTHREENICPRIEPYRKEPERSFHLSWNKNEGCLCLILGRHVIGSELMWTSRTIHGKREWLLAYNVKDVFCNMLNENDDLIELMLKTIYDTREYENGIKDSYFR